MSPKQQGLGGACRPDEGDGRALGGAKHRRSGGGSASPAMGYDGPVAEPKVGAGQDGPLVDSLPWLRWGILAAALAIALAWPVAARTGHAVGLYLLVFVAYNLAVELIRPRRWLTAGVVAVADLAVAGSVYAFDAEPAGPLFTTFYVGVLTAAVKLRPPRALLYTLAAVVVAATIAPTLPRWEAEDWTLRQFASRLTVLALVGVGATLTAHRLAASEATRLSLLRETDRLEEIDRLRADFVAAASHDLRTPLTAIQAGLGLLEASAGDRLRPDERDLMATCRRNADRLRLRVDDLLTFNLLRTGVLRLDREPLDLRVVAASAAATVRPLLENKVQTLTEDLPVPLPMGGDARRLEQLVVDLLDNAHRHSPAGTAVALSGAVAADEIRLSVHDDGPGIAPTDLEAVFERAYRGNPTGGGWGLGLANVRGIADLHGGRVWAERRPGCGTAVHVALPRWPGEGAE